MNDADDNSTVRVFFALWPDASACAALAAWQPPLQQLVGGRIMRSETLHATLVFVGKIEQTRLTALHQAAGEIASANFSVCFDTARYWGHNHIIYAAPSQVPSPLLQLVAALEKSLMRHHVKFDAHEYKAHVTLLRNAHWTDRALPNMAPASWQVREFVLVQSLRQAEGTAYQVLARFPLRASEA